MNYFRALLHKQEYSRRALEVCTEAIYLSPPNYTAWRFRRYAWREEGALCKYFDYLQFLSLQRTFCSPSRD